jgi:ubiquinol-cytochrome c reductase cytochrome b subunit
VSAASPQPPAPAPKPAASASRTGRARDAYVEALPSEHLLPEDQPTYTASWIYVFGLATIAALVVVVVSGAILALKGPAWWHLTSVGHFFNSIHLWSVELFFLFMVVHLWGKFWMAAWRGGRTRVWVTGAIGFLAAIPTALTGYLSQQNFDAQWIATQARDALNAVGVGAVFNVTDFGQMYSWHVLLLPLAVVTLVVAHLLLVRRHGLVPPFEPKARVGASAGPSATAPSAPSGDRAGS